MCLIMSSIQLAGIQTVAQIMLFNKKIRVFYSGIVRIFYPYMSTVYNLHLIASHALRKILYFLLFQYSLKHPHYII